MPIQVEATRASGRRSCGEVTMDAVLGEFLVCRLPRGWAWRAFALVINKFGRFGFHRHIFFVGSTFHFNCQLGVFFGNSDIRSHRIGNSKSHSR